MRNGTRNASRVRHPDHALRLMRRWVVGFCVLILFPLTSAASIPEAYRLARELEYEEARLMLEQELENLDDTEKAEALFLLAQLSGDHRQAHRRLREIPRATKDLAWRFRADLELARLEFARGNYNSVRTYLRRYSQDEARVLTAQSLVALNRNHQALTILENLPATDFNQQLQSWALMNSEQTAEALVILGSLVEGETTEAMPTILLWKAQSESALGMREESLRTANHLQSRFPTSPEAILIEPTLAKLRRPQNINSNRLEFHLQIGAFSERANALRFRDDVPRHIKPLRVISELVGARRVYRVQIGPFQTRELAEAFARSTLNPIDIEWQLLLPEE